MFEAQEEKWIRLTVPDFWTAAMLKQEIEAEKPGCRVMEITSAEKIGSTAPLTGMRVLNTDTSGPMGRPIQSGETPFLLRIAFPCKIKFLKDAAKYREKAAEEARKEEDRRAEAKRLSDIAEMEAKLKAMRGDPEPDPTNEDLEPTMEGE